jgi:hypothetical protein
VRTVRAVSHVHSRWSYDGHRSLEALAAAFARRRCSVVLSTEHDRGFDHDRLLAYRRACERASSEQLLVVPGIEYSDPSNTVHLLVWGDVPFLGEGLPTHELLARAARHDGFVVLAHPWRNNAWQAFDPGLIHFLDGIELWNRKSDGWVPQPRVAELVRTHGLQPFASLDYHLPRQFFPLRMELSIDGPLNERSVLQALRLGDCRPLAMGTDARFFVSGAGFHAANAADQARQSTLRLARWLKAKAVR